MKISFFNFCILSVIICCSCQSKPPAQDSQTNQTLAGGTKMKQEETNRKDASNVSNNGIRYFVNCPYNISVKNGETFQIKMHAVAGTGFTWNVGEATNLVSFNNKKETVYEADPTETSDGETPKVGGKKVQVLEFTATKVGSGNLTLYYARPWEKDKEPTEKCVIAVTVSEK